MWIESPDVFNKSKKGLCIFFMIPNLHLQFGRLLLRHHREEKNSDDPSDPSQISVTVLSV